MTEHIVIANICAPCLRDRRRQVELVRIDTDGGGFELICPACGTVCAVHLDCGELDLEAVREQVASESTFEIEIFTEPWESHGSL